MLLEINTDDRLFVLINIYNGNNELDQIKTLTELNKILDCVDDIQNKNIIFGSDFNIIFDLFLDAQVGNPILKKQSIAKTIQKKERLNLADIWRIQNPKTKRFTFRQHHATGFIQRRLDYFLFLMNYKILLKKHILATFTSDHSPLIFTLNNSSTE